MTPEQREQLKAAAIAANVDWPTNIAHRTFIHAATPGAILSLIAQVEELTVPKKDSRRRLKENPESKLVIFKNNIEVHNFGFLGDQPGSFDMVDIIELMKDWAAKRLQQELEKQTSPDFALKNYPGSGLWDSEINYKKDGS